LRLLGKKGPRMGLCPSQWVYVGACSFGILYQKGVLVTVLFVWLCLPRRTFLSLLFFLFPVFSFCYHIILMVRNSVRCFRE
jgi:hypothetical protein